MHRETRLLGDKATLVQQIREQIVDLVTERLRAGELLAGRMPDESMLRERAGFIVQLALSIARHGWARWAAGEGSTTLGDCILAALGEFRALAAATDR